MIRQHPSPAMTLPISLELYQRLCHAVCTSGFTLEDWEIGDIAIREWIGLHDPDAVPLPTPAGFQWKRLYLPDGTLLRTAFNGKDHHGRIEGGQLLHEGQASSPNRFANVVGGYRRNAWEAIWIMLPNCREWRRASELRPSSPLPPSKVKRRLPHRQVQDRRAPSRPRGN